MSLLIPQQPLPLCRDNIGGAPAAHPRKLTASTGRHRYPDQYAVQLQPAALLANMRSAHTARVGGAIWPASHQQQGNVSSSALPVQKCTSADAGVRSWCPVQSPHLWQGTEETAMQERVPTNLTPPWKMLLLSDGSVTRHLQLLTRAPVQVDCLEMSDIGSSTHGLPQGTELIQGPRVQRQVLLRSSAQPDVPLVYAASWWSASEVDHYLTDRDKPIWVSLSLGHIELYREIQHLWHGHSERCEELLGCKGPFWARQYFFWHNGKPLTLIYEVFSPRLEKYLGPAHLTSGDE